jgi:transitional endoplasmic reticulum ATPase
MDLISQQGGVYIVGATNRPDLLDPSLIKPGRFDKPVYLGLPDKPTRTAILQAQCRRLPLEQEVSADWLGTVEVGEGLSGADIYGVVARAYGRALERAVGTGGEVRVGRRDLEEALEGAVGSVDRRVLGMY